MRFQMKSVGQIQRHCLAPQNHVKCNLKENGSQGREGNRKDHAKSSSRLNVSSVGALTIAIGSFFNEMGSLTEKTLFPGANENCGSATCNRVLEGLAQLAPQKIPMVG